MESANLLIPELMGLCKPLFAAYHILHLDFSFSRGEGCVVIILKPLIKAVKDGDYIYGSVGAEICIPLSHPDATFIDSGDWYKCYRQLWTSLRPSRKLPRSSNA